MILSALDMCYLSVYHEDIKARIMAPSLFESPSNTFQIFKNSFEHVKASLVGVCFLSLGLVEN